MKKLYIVSLLLILTSGNIFSQSGWVTQSSGTNSTLYDICFTDVNTGFAVGVGAVYKTTNSGNNWISLSNVPSALLFAVQFLNSATGYITGDATARTTNGGLNWIHIPDNFKTGYCMFFLNPDIGWIGFEDGAIIRTTSGGVNWSNCGVDSFNVRGIHFADENTGWCTNAKYIYKTINGGTSWEVQYTAINNNFLLTLHFINSDLGWAAGDNVIIKTTNSGVNWIDMSNTGSLFFRVDAVRFVNVNTGFFTGLGDTVLSTTNQGLTWIKTSSNVQNRLESIFFVDENTGWASGWNGAIVKTTNGGGVIGIEPSSADIPKSFSLHQNYPNPFNPVTKIKFDIPSVGNGRDRSVKIFIYDLLGREVATLVNEQLKPGSYEVDWDGSGFASGVYFYSLVTPEFVETKRMVLLK